MLDNPQILRLLHDQHGVVATGQLRDLGVPRRTIFDARRQGVADLILPGVLQVVSHPLTFEARAMAVQLHTDPDGVLSGSTAARILGIRNVPVARIFVLVSERSRTALPSWVERSRSNWLVHDRDAIVVDGFRVLEPKRMLLILAEQFNDFRFERAAEDAWHRKLVTPAEAAEFLEQVRRQGRAGVARFERWIDKTKGRARASQSGFEMEVIQAVRDAGLPEPHRQHPLVLGSGELIHLDLAWPEARLAVEPGHSWWHGGDLGQRKDFTRDNACGEVGWHVMHYDESARADLGRVGREVLSTYRQRMG